MAKRKTKKSKPVQKRPEPPRLLTGPMTILLPDGHRIIGFGQVEVNESSSMSLKTGKWSKSYRALLHMNVKAFTQEKTK